MKFTAIILSFFLFSSAHADSNVIMESWFSSLLDGSQTRFQLRENADFYYGQGDYDNEMVLKRRGVENSQEDFIALKNKIASLNVPSDIVRGECPLPDDVLIAIDSGGGIFVYHSNLPEGRVNLYDLFLECNQDKVSEATVKAARELVEYMNGAQSIIIPSEY